MGEVLDGTGHRLRAVLRRRWKIVAGSAVLGVLAAVLLTALSEPRFTATSTLFITGQSEVSDATTAYQAGLLAEQKAKSYASLVTSDRVALDVAAQLGATADLGPATIRDKITATAETGTALIQVTATDTSPVRAREIAEATTVSIARLVAELEKPEDTESSFPLRLSVVEAAQTPTDPVSPQPVTNLLLGLVMGLLLGGIMAAVRSAFDTGARSVDDLGEVIGRPVLGSTVVDDDPADQPLVMLNNPRTPLGNSVRAVRSSLQYRDGARDKRVLTVTSAGRGEGKTSTACNLAIALAQAGSRVVLIDAHMLSGRLAECFRLHATAGLTDVLAGRQSVESAVHGRCDGNLHVMVGGTEPAQPSDVIASRGMATLVEQLGRSYDYVILDSPALSESDDAAVLTALCDGAILVVRHRRTPAREVRQAISTLESTSGRIVGAVLTMVPRSGPDQTFMAPAGPPRMDETSSHRHPQPHSHRVAADQVGAEVKAARPRPGQGGARAVDEAAAEIKGGEVVASAHGDGTWVSRSGPWPYQRGGSADAGAGKAPGPPPDRKAATPEPTPKANAAAVEAEGTVVEGVDGRLRAGAARRKPSPRPRRVNRGSDGQVPVSGGANRPDSLMR